MPSDGLGGLAIAANAATPSLTQSTITGSPSSLAADGFSTSTITVQLKTAGGANYPASGGTVVLSVLHGTLGAVTDNADGTYTATYTAPASIDLTDTVSGTLAGLALTNTAALTLTAGEYSYLAHNLSGGAAGITWCYSVNGTVGNTAGFVDSVSDMKGVAPDLVATLTQRPVLTGTGPATWAITGDGGNDRLSPAANSSAFDFATLKAIVSIGVFNDANNRVLASIADSLSSLRFMESYSGISNIVGVWAGTSASDSGVAKSTNRRAVIQTQNGSTSGTIRVLSHAVQTFAITSSAGGAGSNRFTIFDDFPGSGSNGTGPWFGEWGLTAVPSAGDVTVIATAALIYHAAVLAA